MNLYSEGYYAVETRDGWGFIDTNGNYLVKPQYIALLSGTLAKEWPLLL